jgi:predicted GNAT family N-acyltransferase
MQVRVVDGAATRELRRAVLRPTWPVGSSMHGDDNPDAVHLATFDGARMVGACLVLPRPYPVRPEVDGAWQLRGMATAEDRRGEGIGGQLLTAAVDEIRRREGHVVWCDARTSAVGFYRQHDFVAEGEEFLHAESGIPHYRMWRIL